MNLSFAQHFATRIASPIIIREPAELISNNFQATLIFSIVKYSINVPITNAGTNRLFSSFDKTADEFSGTAFIFANKTYTTHILPISPTAQFAISLHSKSQRARVITHKKTGCNNLLVIILNL